VRLPNVPNVFNRLIETERNRTLELADQQNRKVGQDVELSGERLILKSPDGTRWSITVSNAGAISATSL
jgi:hypothetical protein